MDHKQVEQIINIHVHMGEEEHGVTARSLALLPSWLPDIPEPTYIYLAYVTEPSWAFWTYVANAAGFAVRFGGFSWGYGGEGCKGLHELIKALGFRQPKNEPPPHTPGIWRLSRRGNLKCIKAGE